MFKSTRFAIATVALSMAATVAAGPAAYAACQSACSTTLVLGPGAYAACQAARGEGDGEQDSFPAGWTSKILPTSRDTEERVDGDIGQADAGYPIVRAS
ncbi:hypothetical protein E4U41_007082 [Claviceps citrina]|nr:hypothetical protein E4U41_007082 [Claviceps citrina]